MEFLRVGFVDEISVAATREADWKNSNRLKWGSATSKSSKNLCQPTRNSEPDGYCHNCGLGGTLISHARLVLAIGTDSCFNLAASICPLIETVIKAPFWALRVAATGVSALHNTSYLLASTTAILLSAITGATNEEHRTTARPPAKALTKEIFLVWKHSDVGRTNRSDSVESSNRDR
jgi:hypothetical protein